MLADGGEPKAPRTAKAVAELISISLNDDDTAKAVAIDRASLSARESARSSACRRTSIPRGTTNDTTMRVVTARVTRARRLLTTPGRRA
jgi:hypothetical protein